MVSPSLKSNLVVGESQCVRILRRDDALHSLRQWFPDGKPPLLSVVPTRAKYISKFAEEWTDKSTITTLTGADLANMTKDDSQKKDPQYHHGMTTIFSRMPLLSAILTTDCAKLR